VKIAFIGPDQCGKSNIAQRLSEITGVPVFKNTDEWKADLQQHDYFLNLLRFGGPFLMNFIKQTDADVILDRFYPCELVYSKAFNRETDLKVIQWMDEQFTSAGGKLILCVKNDYSKIVDDLFPNELDSNKLQQIHDLYLEFTKNTKCEILILETDDHDLDSQISNILNFLKGE